MSSSAVLQSSVKVLSLVDALPKIQSSILRKGGIIGQLLRSPVKPVEEKTKSCQQSVICQPCTLGDRDSMVEFMRREFISREPLMKSVHATPENSRMFVEHWIDEILVQNASFLARNKEDGEICGVRLNAVGPASGVELENDFGFYFNLVPKFLHHMEKDVPKLIGTDRFMRHVAICVKADAIQCGVATDLMKASVRHARQEGLKNMVAMCSWKLPYKLAKTVGFRSVLEVPYDKYAESLRPEGKRAMEPFLQLAATQGSAHTMVRDVQ